MPELTQAGLLLGARIDELEKRVEELEAQLEEVKKCLGEIEKPKPAIGIKEPPKPEHKKRLFHDDS